MKNYDFMDNLDKSILDEDALIHLQLLLASWEMLADLSFSDLLLFAPAVHTDDDTVQVHDETKNLYKWDFIVMGQKRPTTSQTLFPEDLVGFTAVAKGWPLVYSTWNLSKPTAGSMSLDRSVRNLIPDLISQHAGQTSHHYGGSSSMERMTKRAQIQCIPVRMGNKLIAVMASVSSIATRRRPGELESVYMDLFDQLADMVTHGLFPFPANYSWVQDAPRVGDGVVVVDDKAKVLFVSPNATSAFHHMGIYQNIVGRTIGQLGVEQKELELALSTCLPTMAEIEHSNYVTVLLKCMPLVHSRSSAIGQTALRADEAGVSDAEKDLPAEGEDLMATGAIVLLRDVTDLRNRDRLLVSKDAVIKEIHHRVKNNLQTISSLLRMQSRRLPTAQGREALKEAERRVHSIAIVHEILSRDPGEQVPFDEIVNALVDMAKDAVVSGSHIQIVVSGSLRRLPDDAVTPLAVVIAELLQNAVEHGFEDGKDGRVDLVFHDDGQYIKIQVKDNGKGFPSGFDISNTTSLGLSIVRGLVIDQLHGSINIVSSKNSTTLPAKSAGETPAQTVLAQTASTTTVELLLPMDGFSV